jgi:hypothetical protein
VHLVEFFRVAAAHADAALPDNTQPGLFDHRIDRAGEIARSRIGFENGKGTLNRHKSTCRNFTYSAAAYTGGSA